MVPNSKHCSMISAVRDAFTVARRNKHCSLVRKSLKQKVKMSPCPVKRVDDVPSFLKHH